MEIRNEQEYQTAMQRLEYLVDHEPHNLAEITALGNVVDAYEINNGHAPVPPDSLIARIEQEMVKRQLSKGELAKLLEVPASRLSEILHGKRAVNLDFAKRLHHKLGISAEFIMQAAWLFTCCTHGNQVQHGRDYLYTKEFLEAIDENLKKKLGQ